MILAGAVDLDELTRRTPPPECITDPCPPLDPRSTVGDLDPVPEDPLLCSSMSIALHTAGRVGLD